MSFEGQQIHCCRNCVAPKRHIGCHGDCEEYLIERKHLDEENAKRYEEKLKKRNLYEMKADSVRRVMRSHR